MDTGSSQEREWSWGCPSKRRGRNSHFPWHGCPLTPACFNGLVWRKSSVFSTCLHSKLNVKGHTAGCEPKVPTSVSSETSSLYNLSFLLAKCLCCSSSFYLEDTKRGWVLLASGGTSYRPMYVRKSTSSLAISPETFGLLEKITCCLSFFYYHKACQLLFMEFSLLSLNN
jgi:hypothetical protein